MSPSFIVERFDFERRGERRRREFKGLVTLLAGPNKIGKSTALEPLLYALGLTVCTLMPQVRQCDLIRLVFRVGGTRWEATRSLRSGRAKVTFENLSDRSEAIRTFAVKPSKPGEQSAQGFVQELLGIPAVRRGNVSVNLDRIYRGLLALRQATIATEYLGGLTDEERILLLDVVLGLRTTEIDALEAAAATAKVEFTALQRMFREFRKLGEHGMVTDPATLRAGYDDKVREHAGLEERSRQAHAELDRRSGEHGRLGALYKQADKDLRNTRKLADAATAKAAAAAQKHARAEGHLEGLSVPPGGPDDCSACGRLLPVVGPGVCRQCGRLHDPARQAELEKKKQGLIARARAQVEHAKLVMENHKADALAAASARAAAEDKARKAQEKHEAYEASDVVPQRRAATEVRDKLKTVAGEVKQLKKHLGHADRAIALERQVEAANAAMKAANVTLAEALAANNSRRKALVKQWSGLFQARIREIDLGCETALIKPENYTTLVDDKTFEDDSVAGAPRVIINVAVLLSLRDLARVVPTVTVPPFLLIDSPLTGFGAQGDDHDTGVRLMNTLITAADDPSPDGYACQIVTTAVDPLERDYPGLREIRLSPDNRFFDHAPLVRE
ncbi:hypothetical protein [Embleya sp. NPDC020630]|uniref:hypothetical protein n=1 Tax=Embleya sp. NPDC020630 TaxID=3363979 RepID=UPI0037A379E3